MAVAVEAVDVHVTVHVAAEDTGLLASSEEFHIADLLRTFFYEILCVTPALFLIIMLLSVQPRTAKSYTTM